MTDIIFDPNKNTEFYYTKMIDFKNKYDAEKNKNDLLLEQKKNNSFFVSYDQNTKKKCELCNIEVRLNSYTNHLKTKKHLLKEFKQEGLDIPTQTTK